MSDQFRAIGDTDPGAQWLGEEMLGDHSTDVESANESLGMPAVFQGHGGRDAATRMFHKTR